MARSLINQARNLIIFDDVEQLHRLPKYQRELVQRALDRLAWAPDPKRPPLDIVDELLDWHLPGVYRWKPSTALHYCNVEAGQEEKHAVRFYFTVPVPGIIRVELITPRDGAKAAIQAVIFEGVID